MSFSIARTFLALADRGLLPDPVLRAGCRYALRQRLREERATSCEERAELLHRTLSSWRSGEVARLPELANEQHYELPPEFFAIMLGPHRKYSSCLWREGTTTLEQAEAAALEETCQRAGIAGGQRILELGCGWGSLTLWMAERYPSASITAVSNSAPQREHITAEARRRGLDNVEVITCDINRFDTDERFDRVVSVEMLEHVSNHAEVLRRISTWLAPGGRLFIHVFCHADLAYAFSRAGDDDFIGRHFFSGGVMPSDSLFLHHQEHLVVARQWRWSGTHYQKTAEAWLENLDANREEALEVLAGVYGEKDARMWLRRWRLFVIACAELWGFRGGEEWWVSHTLMQLPERTARLPVGAASHG
jgi:cyclopropane-fatty-acyl-phospholipid synthase